MDDDDRAYLEQLRADMADPTQGPWMQCGHCGHRFHLRAWPGEVDDHEVIAAMLDGLADLQARTRMPAFALYLLKDERGELPSPEDLEARVQLWRPGDAVPLVDGPQRDVLFRMVDDHDCVCPMWN